MSNVLDFLYLGILIFVLVIVVMISYQVLYNFAEATEDTLNQTYIEKGLVAMTVWDSAVLVLVVMSFVAVVIGVFLVRSHPAFTIMSIIFMFVMLFLSGLFTNIYEDVALSDNLYNSSVTYTIIPEIMHNFPLIIGVFIVIVGIVLYGKSRGDTGI